VSTNNTGTFVKLNNCCDGIVVLPLVVNPDVCNPAGKGLILYHGNDAFGVGELMVTDCILLPEHIRCESIENIILGAGFT
jgi:hypothetical protein